MEVEISLPERPQGIYYGLEDHLEKLRKESRLCEKLHASWIVDREKYKKRQEAANLRYPHFSEHNECHSQQIIAAVEFILGESRIRQLSASDTWLLLQVAYAHDVGMALTAEELIRKMKGDDAFHREVRDACRRAVSARAWDAYQYIRPLIEADRPGREEYRLSPTRSQRLDMEQKMAYLDEREHARGDAWPIQLMDAFTTVIESYIRVNHAGDSADALRREAIDENFSSRHDPVVLLRHRLLVSEICRLHTADQEEIMRLPQQINGLCHDWMYPRFAAILLRLGDLLDMDNNRFNQAQLAVVGENRMTNVHWMKHESVTELLITPLRISVKADFKRRVAEKILLFYRDADCDRKAFSKEAQQDNLCMEACRSLFEWLRWLRAEIEFLSVHWQAVVPRKTEGAAPVFEEPELLIDGRKMEEEELHLRYEITTKRAAEIIEGTGLYSSPHVTFLREVTQNAIDATKRQLIQDILSKRFPEFAAFTQPEGGKEEAVSDAWLRDFQNAPDAAKRRMLQSIREKRPPEAGQTADEPMIRLTPLEWLYELSRYHANYRIEYKVWVENNELCVYMRDYGVGITYRTLKGMLKIGKTPGGDDDRLLERAPAWLWPTSDFGIGLQSVFYMTKSFFMRSRPHAEEGYASPPLRRMKFFSTRMGGEIEVLLCGEEDANKFGYGTEVDIRIPLSSVEDRAVFYQEKENETPTDAYGNVLHDAFDSTMDDVRLRVERGIGRFYGAHNMFPLVNRLRAAETPPSTLLGKFCVNLDENRVYDTGSDAENDRDAFSCWSGSKQILIRYRKRGEAKNFRRDSRVDIYYKGILIENTQEITAPLRLWFWDAEIHVFADPAGALLAISRENVLAERRKWITQKIQETHLSCLLLLFQKEWPGERDAFDWLWEAPGEPSDANSLYAFARCYLRLLLLRYTDQLRDAPCPNISAINKSPDPVMAYEMMGDVIRPLRFMELENTASIWFLAHRRLPEVDIFLRASKRSHSETSALLVQDLFYLYHEMAAIRFRLIRPQQPRGYQSCVPIYQLGKRTSVVVASDADEYWEYVDSLIAQAIRAGHDARRLVFPSCEAYAAISVTQLNDGMADDEIQKFVSYIIAPYSVGELRECLQQHGGRNVIGRDWATKNDKLVQHVHRYAVNSDLRKKTPKVAGQLIRNTYQSFLSEFLKRTVYTNPYLEA